MLPWSRPATTTTCIVASNMSKQFTSLLAGAFIISLVSYPLRDHTLIVLSAEPSHQRFPVQPFNGQNGVCMLCKRSNQLPHRVRCDIVYILTVLYPHSGHIVSIWIIDWKWRLFYFPNEFRMSLNRVYQRDPRRVVYFDLTQRIASDNLLFGDIKRFKNIN
jgi:hypothetical protein